jgi:hypothetical protein
VLGIDIVAVTRDLRVAAAHVYEGDEAVLTVSEKVLELARRFNVVEAAHDPWRWRSEALRAEQQGLRVVEFRQSHARMTVASEGLHSAVVEKRLRHPGHRDLDRHVAAAVAPGYRPGMAARQVRARRTDRRRDRARDGGGAGRAPGGAGAVAGMDLGASGAGGFRRLELAASPARATDRWSR